MTPLFAYNGGLLRDRQVRRILALAGWDVRLGWPKPDQHIGVWGQSPTAGRGARIAQRTGARQVWIEDAFLRSVHPGRSGEAPLGLLIDRRGPHFDPAQPSDLERLLTTAALDDSAMLTRARALVAQLQRDEVSKYSAFDPDAPLPDPGYVLVVDQTRGDAAVTASGATRATFTDMLVQARLEHPGAQVLIRTHPETAGGHRAGYFTEADTGGPVHFAPPGVSPWQLLAGAVGVYTVSSTLGFEAILAGHRPRVFGQPFYAGWGLSQDEFPLARRTRCLTAAQLAVAALFLYPVWYDPHFDRLAEPEEVARLLGARARAWREDRAGYDAVGIRLWKRAWIKRAFGGDVRFRNLPSPRSPRPVLAWGTAPVAAPRVLRVEDGFLRSRGLGAELVPPLSLVRDDLGLYYDPAQPSRLEALIAASSGLPPAEIRRAERLIAAIRRRNLTKYNLDAEPVDISGDASVLVVGQVEDDASVQLGCPGIATNRALLMAARAAHPDACLIYKPHPDVEAGLRPGRITASDLADVVADNADPLHLIDQVGAVWTMTSLLGFEALLRDKPVTCLGVPFYAGWGLTEDRAPTPERRKGLITLAGLVHATLIGYPRYIDPVTGSACPPETLIERLSEGAPRRGAGLRALSKLQGVLASADPFWR